MLKIKYILILFIGLILSFVFIGQVSALGEKCCVYYQGNGPSNDCMDDINYDPNIISVCPNPLEKGFLPKNVKGSYITNSDESCISISGFTVEKKSISTSNSYNTYICVQANGIMQNAGAEGLGPLLAEAQLGKVKNKLDELKKNTCCVPKKVDSKNKCHTPEYNNKSYEDFVKAYNDGSLIPDASKMKVIEDIPLWEYLDCGNGDWHHWNMDCNSRLPLVPTTDNSSGYEVGTINDYQVIPIDQISYEQTKSILSSEKFCGEISEETVTEKVGTGAVELKGLKGLDKLGTLDAKVMIGRIIKTVMGVMGSIFLLMLIYAGVLWMVAHGSAEKIKKAGGIIIWSTLGIIVILASYAIVSFIFDIF